MNNQPVIFNIQYTPYKLPRNATKSEVEKHAEERAFYDMSGEKNIYGYITTEGKRTGKKTALEYLQKSTGVFNNTGLLEQERVDEMKSRLKENKGNIYHGFISLNEEQSYKIDTPEKCIELVGRIFPSFLQDAKFHKDNVDLICALHMDKPHHLHIHFVFWEKKPKYKGKDGELTYRRRGKIDKKSIDNMFVRLGLYLEDNKDTLYKSRTQAIADLKKITCLSSVLYGDERIKKEIISLSKVLPNTGRLTYGSKEMQPLRDRVDKIVEMILLNDKVVRKLDRNFYEELAKREREIMNICGKDKFAYSNQKIKVDEIIANEPKYHNKIDEENIHIIEDIKVDYKRRQGNLVLSLAKYIKQNFVVEGKKHKANDIVLKRNLGIAKRQIDRACKKFFTSFGSKSEVLRRDYFNRLKEIEEEIEKGRRKDEKENQEGTKEGK